MSSFRKRNIQKPINGTRTSLQTGQVITSSGNSSLDSILGGGLPLGSITLIEEDKYNTYAKILTKYFLAEGIASMHPTFFGSLDDEPNEFIKKLPNPLDKPNDDNENSERDSNSEKIVDDGAGGDKNGLRIAWRYNDLLPVNSEQATTKIGHNFNLAEQIDKKNFCFVKVHLWNNNSQNDSEKDLNCSDLSQESDLQSSDEQCNDQQQQEQQSTSEQIKFHCEKYFRILESLSKIFNGIKSEEHEDSEKHLNRICISSLGSPLWFEENFTKDILKFLSILRALVRNSTSVCFLTMPMHLFSHLDASLVSKIRNLVDFSIEMESFVGSDYETNPAYKEYNGLIHLRKISAINTLNAYRPNTTDLAFKLRRKKFVIEKLHLPPELGETNDNDRTPALSCSSGNNPLDF